MAICLGIVSGKGGTGKSTVSAGLAIAFARLKKSVLLIDLDAGLRCLDLVLGIDGSVVYDLSDIFEGGDAEDAVYTSLHYALIKVIPAPAQPGSIDPEKLSVTADYVKKKFDVVIFDFPAGIDTEMCKAVGADTLFLTVCNPDPVSVKDAAVMCGNLPPSQNSPRLLINKFDKNLIISGIYDNIDSIIDRSGLRLIGIIPVDSNLMLLPVNHKIKNNSCASAALDRIAGRISGKSVKLPNPKKI